MKAWLLAWQFLTRLPVKVRGNVDQAHLATSIVFYPAVGAILGAGLYLVNWQSFRVLPPLTCGLLLVGLQILLTGGLHVDGLCDLTDGWYGSNDREKRLTIMKDSRIGALGAISLVLVILLKASLLAVPRSIWLVLVLYEAGAKMMMVLAVGLFPYARSTGTGALLGQVQTRHVLAAAVLPLVLLAFAPWKVGLACCLAWAAGLFLVSRWSGALGGLTGDCYGAVHELWQVLFLLTLEVLL